jgi:hypothetical protein
MKTDENGPFEMKSEENGVFEIPIYNTKLLARSRNEIPTKYKSLIPVPSVLQL